MQPRKESKSQSVSRSPRGSSMCSCSTPAATYWDRTRLGVSRPSRLSRQLPERTRLSWTHGIRLGQSFDATVSLEALPPQPPPPTGIPPRFQTYPAPTKAGGAESSGEPSIGVDWNPNVAALKYGTVNPGGVAFFTANL